MTKLRLSIKGEITQQKPSFKPETQVIKAIVLYVLVVDDNDDICELLDKLLSSEGHLVRTVNNGAEAIILTELVDYDLVLCDMSMPEVNGYDVVKVLNGLKNKPKIGIITGLGDDRISDRDMKVDFFLRKPFKHAELIEHIDELFGAYSK